MKIQSLISTFKISLLFIFIATLCSSTQLHDEMSDEEIYDIFHTKRDEVPLYEYVKINPLPSIQLKGRLSIQTRFLSFTAFGRHYDLQLKLRDDVLIGKNVPIWHVESSGHSNISQIKYIQLKNIRDDIHGIYQDSSNMVSLLEYKYLNNDQFFYDGTIAFDLAISPLPERLINILSNNKNKSSVDHIVFKITSQNETFDDALYVPDINRKYNQKQIRSQPLEVMYPEILVVVDASFYEHLGKNPHLAMNYLVPFWNGVDLRYSLLKAPKVRLNIAGIILARDEKALQFIYKNLDNSGRIEAKKALIDAGEYFNSETKFITSKDIIVIMTKRDICSSKYTNYCKSSALGKAFTGKACSKKKNTAILEDNGGYAGIITATHEIGHLLGLPHDGEDDAVNCSMKDGYIMASAKFRSINSHCWSSCSKKLLRQFASLTVSNCLENKPEIRGGLMQQRLPGKILTLEEQCLARGGKPCIFNATICWKLHCTKSMINLKCIGKAPAAEGSKCGDGLYCRNGDCIPETSDILIYD